MSVRMCIVIVVAMACVLPMGCGSNRVRMAPPRELTEEQLAFEAVFLASQDVLIDFGFEVDRRDRRRGEVTGKPMLARHGMEFWRRDATTSYDMAEGMLQKIYVVPSVKIEPTSPSGDEFGATVTVERLRSSVPERTLNRMRLISTAPGDSGTVGPRAYGETTNFVRLQNDEHLAMQIESAIFSAALQRRAELSTGR